MYSSTKSKTSFLQNREDSYPNYNNMSSPKIIISSATSRELSASKRDSAKKTPTTGYKTPTSAQKSNNSSYYKNKRPVEMNDALESAKPAYHKDRSHTTEATALSNFESPISQDISSAKTPFLTTRQGSYNDEKLSPDDPESNNYSCRNAPTTQKASYIAEKVYSMKMKGTGILSSLVPLAKSRSPTNVQMLKQPASATQNRSAVTGRDLDGEQPSMISSTKSGSAAQSGFNDKDNRFAPKTATLNSQKSLGKLLNDGKNPSASQKDFFKRENSIGIVRKPTIKSGHKTPTAKTTREPETFTESDHLRSARNAKGKSLSISTTVKRADLVVNKINKVCSQVNQRNKRLVLVILLERLHQYKVKITKYFERKSASMKSKYFFMWQHFILEVLKERQMEQQEKAEEMKMSLASAFWNRKMLRKYFNLLIPSPDIHPKTTTQITTSSAYKVSRPFRQSSISITKPLSQTKLSTQTLYQSKTSTVNTYQNKNKVQPQQQQAPKQINKQPEKSIIKPEKIPLSSRTPLSTESRSKSVGKILRDVRSPSTSRIGSPTHALTPTNQSKKATRVNTPTSKRGTSGYPRFGKSVTYLQEPAEIEEAVNSSKNVVKKDKNVSLNQSTTGTKNPSKPSEKNEKVHEAFDSILAEILHAPGTAEKDMILEPSRLSVAPEELVLPVNTFTPTNKIPVARNTVATTSNASASKNVKRSNFFSKPTSPARTTRDASAPKKINKDLSKSQIISSKSKQEEQKKIEESSKVKTVKKTTMKSANTSFRQKDIFEEEDSEKETLNNEKAINFYNKKLYRKYGQALLVSFPQLVRKNEEKALNHHKRVVLQDSFVWLQAVVSLANDDSLEKKMTAENHYQSNLKIKCLSGILDNYVKGFKQNHLSMEHYRTKLLMNCFLTWSEAVPELAVEKQESEEAYNDIVERFRYIVLAEKALRVWKDIIHNKKKLALQQQKKKLK